MVSDRDIRNAAPPFTYGSSKRTPSDLLGEPVAEIMSSNVTSIDPEAEVEEIIDLMLENKVGALPVLDDHSGELVGIVSYVDVLRALRSAA